MTLPQDVGTVLMLRVHKEPRELHLPLGSLPPDAWFCRWFQLEWLPGAALRFPCYRWLEGAGDLVLREGTGERGGSKELVEAVRGTTVWRRLSLRHGGANWCGHKEGTKGDWQKPAAVEMYPG